MARSNECILILQVLKQLHREVEALREEIAEIKNSFVFQALESAVNDYNAEVDDDSSDTSTSSAPF